MPYYGKAELWSCTASVILLASPRTNPRRALHGCYQEGTSATFRTSFPRTWPVSINRCARAASSSGSRLSRGTLTNPRSIKLVISRIDSLALKIDDYSDFAEASPHGFLSIALDIAVCGRRRSAGSGYRYRQPSDLAMGVVVNPPKVNRPPVRLLERFSGLG